MLEKMTFLRAAENRETFFKRIALGFPRLAPEYRDIDRTYNTVKDAFRDVTRDGGDRYFEHLRAVTLILIDYLRVKSPIVIQAGLLHDIAEDKNSWTIERVQLEFGYDVAVLVDWMSKPPLTEYPSKEARDAVYHGRFRNAPREFFLIKLADRLHNLMTLKDCTPEKQARKIEETKRYYLPYAEEHMILYHEINEALENLEKVV